MSFFKKIKIFLLLCCGSGLAVKYYHYQTPVKQSSLKILRIGTSPDYAPFSYQSNGELMGFEIDLCCEIGKNVNMEVVFEKADFIHLTQMLSTKKIDMIVSSMQKTPEREKNFDFSIPYYESSLICLYFKDSAEIIDNPWTENIVIMTQTGSFASGWIKEYYPQVTLIQKDDAASMIIPLQQKNINCLILDKPQAYLMRQNNPDIMMKTLSDHGINRDNAFCVVLNKDNLLLPKINESLKQLKNEGIFDILTQKWINKSIISSDQLSGYNFYLMIIRAILKGLGLTLILWLTSLIFGIFFGFLMTIVIYRRFKGSWFAYITSYILSFIRGTPLAGQLFIVYFLISSLVSNNISINNIIIITGITTFSLNSMAYVCEMFYSALLSIPEDQFNACKVLNIPNFYVWKRMIGPQIIRNAFPSLINESISLLKETSIISMIGGEDIMRQAQLVGAETFLCIPPMLMACFTYYILTVIIKNVLQRWNLKY